MTLDEAHETVGKAGVPVHTYMLAVKVLAQEMSRLIKEHDGDVREARSEGYSDGVHDGQNGRG